MTKKTKRILLIAAGIILLIFIIVKIASVLASDRLSELLNKEAKSYYINFEEVEVSLFTQSIELNDILIKPLKENKTGVFSTVERFEIQGVSFIDLLFNNQLTLSELTVEKANTKVNLVKREDQKDEKPLKQFLKEMFSKVKLKNIKLNECSLEIVEDNDTIPSVKLERFSLSFEDVVLDTVTVKKTLPFSVSSIEGFINRSKFKVDSIYDLHFSQLKFSKGSITIDSLNYKTELSKDEFQRKMPIQKDWINFLVPKLDIVNYNWKTDSTQFYFNADKFCLYDMDLLAYRDKNLPFGPHTQKPMPSEMLRSIPFNLNVDTIQVKKGRIQYQEKAEGKKVKGNVYFTKVYATIYNICNDSLSLLKNPWLSLDAQATFNHCGHLQTHWEFKVPDPQDHFKVTGQLGKMDINCLNKTFKPMLDVKAKGTVHQVKFNFNGDYAHSKGEVLFDYEGLQVQFQDQNKDFKNWLKSTVGNVVLRSDNLPSNSNYQKGEIDFERIQHKSVFNYLWKSLQNGLKPVVIPFKGEKVE